MAKQIIAALVFSLVLIQLCLSAHAVISVDGRPDFISPSTCSQANYQGCNPFKSCQTWVQGLNPFAHYSAPVSPTNSPVFLSPWSGSAASPYGRPLMMTWPPYTGDIQISGLTYSGRLQTSVTTGVPFVIGKLTHNNYPIDSRTQICNHLTLTVPFVVNIDGGVSGVVSITTPITVEETPNDACSSLYNDPVAISLWSPEKTSGETCSCPFEDACTGDCTSITACSCGKGCRDRVSFDNSAFIGSQSFSVNGQAYSITLLGFNSQSDASQALTLTPTSSFVTTESDSSSAYIWAKLEIACTTNSQCTPNSDCDTVQCISGTCQHSSDSSQCGTISDACAFAVQHDSTVVPCEAPVCTTAGCDFQPASADCPTLPEGSCSAYSCQLTGGNGPDAECNKCVARQTGSCSCDNGCCGICNAATGECTTDHCPTTTPCVGCSTTTTTCPNPCGMGCGDTSCQCDACINNQATDCNCCQPPAGKQFICVWKGRGQEYDLVTADLKDVASYFQTAKQLDPVTGNFFAGQTHIDDSAPGNVNQRPECKFNCDCTCPPPTTTTTPLPSGIIPLIHCVRCNGNECFVEIGYDASATQPDPQSTDTSYVTRTFATSTNNYFVCVSGCGGGEPIYYYLGVKGNPDRFYRQKVPVAFTLAFAKDSVLEWHIDGSVLTVTSAFGVNPLCPSSCEFPAGVTSSASNFQTDDGKWLLSVEYFVDLSPLQVRSDLCPVLYPPTLGFFVVDIPACAGSVSVKVTPDYCGSSVSFFDQNNLVLAQLLGDSFACLNASVESGAMRHPLIITMAPADGCQVFSVDVQVDKTNCPGIDIGLGTISTLWNTPCTTNCDTCRTMDILGLKSGCPTEAFCHVEGETYNPDTCSCTPCTETCPPDEFLVYDANGCHCDPIPICSTDDCFTTPPPNCPPTCGYDRCGVCCGDNTQCAGCDGDVNSPRYTDHCGVPCGDGSTCPSCYNNTCNVCAAGVIDKCGVCGGNDTTCYGCDYVPASGKTYDVCGVCDGNGTSCLGCAGVPFAGPCPSGITTTQAAVVSGTVALAALSALILALILLRIRKRPELLYQAWDDAISDYISDIIDSPIYNHESEGVNPLHARN